MRSVTPSTKIHSGKALRVLAKLKFEPAVRRPEIVIGMHTTYYVYLPIRSIGVLDANSSARTAGGTALSS